MRIKNTEYLESGALVTVSVSVQTHDGLVLAADSATTLTFHNGQQLVYDNANKVFNLHKELPVGVVTWGLGSINNASIETLVKDFRKRITTDPKHKVDTNSYTIEDIASRFCDFIYDEQYLSDTSQGDKKHGLGFIIGGYSNDNSWPEQWLIQVEDETGACVGPQRIAHSGAHGAMWYGITEPLMRLFNGYSIYFPQILEKIGLQPEQVTTAMSMMGMALQTPLVTPGMPIQDAIDLAQWMVELTAQYVKFSPGHNIVGGTIEIAAITKHEGFKWIRRKLYYRQIENPNT